MREEKFLVALLVVLFFFAGAVWAGPSFLSTEKEKTDAGREIRLSQVYYPKSQPLQKTKPDHSMILTDRTPCLNCHDDPAMGYGYVNKAKFTETLHYKAMVTRGIKEPQEACISCHVSKEGKFVVNPSDNWFNDAGDAEKVSNDMDGTCGKCHEAITRNFTKSLHATKKGVYYSLKDLPPPRAEKAFGMSAFNLYSTACATCHASCSSCHLIGKDKQAIDWKYVNAHAQRKIGTVEVPIAKGITSEAKILAMGPNRNPKAGGPLYRNLARQGLVPIETVKFDIESHDFIVPGRLDPSRANDICYRCHENPGKEFYGIGLDNSYGYSSHALAGMKCVDCHGKEEVHGSGTSELYISRELKVRCSTCHIQGEKVPPHLNQTFAAQAKKVEVAGAHQNLQCAACHAKFYGSCIACHFDRPTKARYVETNRNTEKPLVYFGKNIEGKVQIVTTTPRRGMALDEKEDGGIWMMQSRHSIQKSVYQDCGDCHFDPVKMGVNPLERPILNKWEMASIGVPKAFLDRKEHYASVKADPKQTCESCHRPGAKNRYEAFHLAKKKP